MIWNKEETFSRKEIEELQTRRLKALVKRAYDKVTFYRESFEKAGVKPRDIKKLDDLKKLPFTVKDDLRENYPYKMFAVPMTKVIRVHASSGTTGKPTVVGYTKKDIDTWANLMARALASAGTHENDIVHNAYGYGLFTGGLGAHYGAEKLGATVIPVSGGNTQRQLMIMQDFGSTILCATPSYALNMADVAENAGIDFSKMKLRAGLFGAEPWSNNMRVEIEKRLHLDAVDIYGLSEIIGPGVSCECVEEKAGPHIFEDNFIPEIIDPETLEVLPPGEKGELVFTTLTKEAFPLIRYRTRDISSIITEPCPCGRTHYRMEKVSGRTDDMLIIRGVNFFPSQIEQVLLQVEGLEPHYQIIVDRVESMDRLEVQIEMNEKLFSDEMKKIEQLQKRLQHDIKDYLGVSTKVTLVEPRTIARSEGKAKRVIDKRSI